MNGSRSASGIIYHISQAVPEDLKALRPVLIRVHMGGYGLCRLDLGKATVEVPFSLKLFLQLLPGSALDRVRVAIL